MSSSITSSSLVYRLLQRCTGQHVQIPFLPALFPQWSASLNPNCNQSVQDALDQFQETWMKDPVALRRNRGTDPVLFARSVFPDAAIEDLTTVVIWISWLYFWDDALDFGDLDNKTGRMSQYREETLSCIQHSLLDDGLNEDKDPIHIAPTCLAAQAWHSIGVHIQHRVTAPSSRKYMHDCLRDYVAATIELQMHCDKAEILDIDSYLAIRMRTSGVYPTISLYLLTSRCEPPDWFFSHRLVQAALIEMNRIVSIYNDIVSAHLEIESGHIDNIIPLLMHHKSLSAQGAVDEAVQMIQDSYAAFRCLEAQITTLGREQDIAHEVSAFLKGCVNLCMGALQWTYHIKRYFNYSPSMGPAEIPVVLGYSDQTAGSDGSAH